MHTRDQVKARAAKLRDILKELGNDINHAHALEAVSRLQGYKDWNTCAAAMDRKEKVLPIPKGWQAGGDRREHYDIGIDNAVMFDGAHPAVIRYRQNAPDDATGFATFMQSFDADGYQGKRLKFSAVMKCEDCDGATTIWMRADSDTVQAVAFDNLEDREGASNGPISGSTDWSERTIVLDIPTSAAKISIGFYVRGQGAGYATGFAIEEVAVDVPVTTGRRTGRDGPVNMGLEGA